jgi:hypothetical protein
LDEHQPFPCNCVFKKYQPSSYLIYSTSDPALSTVIGVVFNDGEGLRFKFALTVCVGTNGFTASGVISADLEASGSVTAFGSSSSASGSGSLTGGGAAVSAICGAGTWADASSSGTVASFSEQPADSSISSARVAIITFTPNLWRWVSSIDMGTPM